MGTSSFLRVSKSRKDNLLYHDRPTVYALLPLSFPALLALDLILLPVTLINDAYQSLSGAPDEPPHEQSFPNRFRDSVHSVISVH